MTRDNEPRIDVINVLHRFSDDNEDDFRPADVGVMNEPAQQIYDDIMNAGHEEAALKFLRDAMPAGFTDDDISFYIRPEEAPRFYGCMLADKEYDAGGEQIFIPFGGELAMKKLGLAYKEYREMQNDAYHNGNAETDVFATRVLEIMRAINKTIK